MNERRPARGGAPLGAPERVGKFRLLFELGSGGMARVFLGAVQGPARFEKLLAVKLLREELAADPELVEMFLDEARLAAKLNHPNVVHTYEVGREGPHCYLAMDYLEGPSFGALLRRVGREAMRLDLHVLVLCEVLAGLHHAHELAGFDGAPLRVVHRDVSPKNVIVTHDGQVKLVDFGIAKAADASARTAQGAFKGTTAYAAPEQARGLDVDARADVFAVGVMLWEALARRPLALPGAEIAALANRVVGAEPRVAEVADDVPPALAAVCDRAMAFEPADRYPSALALRDALEAWLDGLPKRTSSRELAALVGEAFAVERSTLRRHVEEQLRRVEGAGDPGQPADSFFAQAEAVSTTRVPHVSDAGPTDASRRGGPGVWFGAAVVATSLAAGAALVARWPRARGPAVTAAALVAPSAAGSAASVGLTFRYGPAGATASIDGVRLHENPFRGRFPRDGAVRQVEVSAPGYVAERRLVAFDRDLDLAIELSAEGPAPPAPRTPPIAASGAAARPRPPAPPAPPARRHAIDAKNPYQD